MKRKLLCGLMIIVFLVVQLPMDILAEYSDEEAEDGYQTVSISNDYLELTVLDEEDSWLRGRYYLTTTDGNPYFEEDNNKVLLSNNFDEWERDNFWIIVDMEQIPFIVDEGSDIVVDDENDIITATMTYEDIIITQKLQFVEGDESDYDNMLKISYTFENTSDTTHDVGGVLMLDTAVGDNGGPYFDVYEEYRWSYDSDFGNKTVTYSVESTDEMSGGTYDALSFETIGDTDDTLVGYGEIDTFGEDCDEVQYVYLPDFYNEYDYYDGGYDTSSSQSILEDSGVVYSWDEQELEENESITYGTKYGIYPKDTISSDYFDLDVNSINGDSYYTTFNIDGDATKYGNDNITMSQVTSTINSSDYIDDIKIEKEVQIDTDNDDYVKVTYTVTNEGNESHELGVRLKTYKTSGYPYLPGIGKITDNEYYSEDVPDYFDFIYYTENSTKSYTLRMNDETGVSEEADALAFVTKDYSGIWDYVVPEYIFYSINAAYVYWYPDTIEPNETKTYSYRYERLYDAVSTVSNYDYLVSVQDEYGLPVEDAKISRDGNDYYTDEDGNITFTAKTSDSLEISKTYYYTVSCSGGDPGETIHVTLYANTDDPFVESVEYVDSDGETINILEEISSLYTLEDDVDSIYFTIDGNFGDYEEGVYEIIQDDEVIASGSSSEIEVAVSDLINYEKLYVRIQDSNGSYSNTEETGLYVLEKPAFENSVPDLPGADFIFGGNSISLTVPDGVPIFGDESIDIGIDDLADLGGLINIDDDSTVQIAIGTDISVAEDLASFKKTFEKASEDSTYISSANEVDFFAGSGSVNAEIMGYGEGYVDNDIMYVDLSVIFTLSGEYEVNYQLTLGVIPVYFDGAVGGSGSLEGTYELTYDLIDGWEINGAVGSTASLESYVSIEAGVGSSKVASVSGEATISLTYEYDLMEDEQLLEATGSLVAKVKAFMFSKSKTIAEKTWTLYDTTSTAMTEANVEDMIATYNDYIYDQDSYTLIDSAINKPINRFMTIASADFDISDIWDYSNYDYYLESQDIYPGTIPRLIHFDNKDFIFFIVEDDSRDTANSAKLVYATRDLSEGNYWSNIITIDDDGTADFNFDIAVDEENDLIDIVWQNMTKEFDDDVEMSDITENVAITHATISTTNSAITVQELSTTSDYVLMPEVASYNGETFVSWIENDSDDVFALSGNSDIVKVDVTTTTGSSIKVVEAIDDVVVSVDAGYLENKEAIAYELDLDGDIYTTEDREVYIVQEGNIVKLTDDELGDLKPQFVEVEGTQLLMWHRNGNLYYIDSVDGELVSVFTDDNIMYSDTFEVISGNSDTKIIWTEPSSDDEYTSVIMVSELYDDGTWSTPYELYNHTDELTVPNGYIDDDSDFEFVGIKTDQDEELDWNMYIQTMYTYPDIAVTDVEYDHDDVKLGEELDIEVTINNCGQENINDVEVEILYDDTVIGSQTISDEVLIGESKEVTVTITVPEDVTSLNVFTANVVTAEDYYYPDNNEMEFIIGYADLSIEVETVFDRGTKYASITVTNLSPFVADATLFITSDSLYGDTISEYTLGEIDNENFTNVLVNMTGIMEEVDTNVFYAYVETDSSEAYTYNNSEMIYLVDYSEYETEEDSVVDESENEDDEDDEDDDEDDNNTIKIEYFSETSNVSLDLVTNSMVNIEVFEELKETENATLTLNGDGYTYVFTSEGELYDYKESDIDFNIEMNREEDGIVILALNHSGVLPMNGELTVSLGEEYENKKLYLSYTDAFGGDMLWEVISCDVLGNLTFSITNGADYILSEDIILDDDIFLEDVNTKSIISGYTDGTFKPDQDMTRQEVAYLLNSLLEQSIDDEVIEYSDVDNWAKDAITNMVSYGFMDGYGDGTFKGNSSMTRLEFIEVIYNMLGLSTLQITSENEFYDISDYTDDTYIDACYDIGLIEGGNNQFRPNDDITRAEVITILNRMLSRETNTINTEITFKDLSKDHWAYNQIMSAIK